MNGKDFGDAGGKAESAAAPRLSDVGLTPHRARERLLARLQERGIGSMQVLDLIRGTPRHMFLDEALAHRAYEDVALPIGYKQTISQPYIVARMTEAVLLSGPLDRVLEIGTGCGYQTAIIARVATTVHTVERINPLLQRARENLQALGLANIAFKLGDGTLGWPEQGPFDAIIATAAPHAVPRELTRQLAEGGRLIIPVGGGDCQELRMLTRAEGKIRSQTLDLVRFVPLLAGPVQR